jgi:hypothetical protein
LELEQPFLHDLLRVGLNESRAEEVHDGVDQAMLPRACLVLLRAVARRGPSEESEVLVPVQYGANTEPQLVTEPGRTVAALLDRLHREPPLHSSH